MIAAELPGLDDRWRAAFDDAVLTLVQALRAGDRRRAEPGRLPLVLALGVEPRTELAEFAGLTVEDGVVVDLVDGKARIVGQVPAAHVYVDGGNVGTSDEDLLKDRRILGEEGFISVVATVNLRDQSLENNDYYGNTLKLLSMIVMSGAWLRPDVASGAGA